VLRLPLAGDGRTIDMVMLLPDYGSDDAPPFHGGRL